MNSTDQQILHTVSNRIKQKFPGAQIWAFGSRARGDATGESDLDVCVVIQNLTPETRREVSAIAWEVGFDKDVLLSTVVFSAADNVTLVPEPNSLLLLGGLATLAVSMRRRRTGIHTS